MNIRLRHMASGLVALVAAATFSSLAVAADAGGIAIVDAWARPSAIVGGNGAGYFTVENQGEEADTLLKVEADVSKSVELHTMTMDGMVMRMRKITSAVVPPHGKLVFAPGGNHVMFIGLKAPLKEGDSLPVTLVFEHAGAIETAMSVRKPMPAPERMKPMDGMGAMPGMDR